MTDDFRLLPQDPPRAPRPAAGPRRLPSGLEAQVRRLGRIPEDEVRWPAHFVEYLEVAVAGLRALPAGARPQEQALAALVAIAAYVGPGRDYWPSAAHIHRAARDWHIYHCEWDGRNAAAIAKRHNLTVRMVHVILAKQRQFAREARARRRG
ncbi:Mor transcription activator family protein [uncultured Lamprocystis sp.]|jgi:Mor family transcriptional regulator|uniref:Mor transcription activator family protein n=1 Tax=uncultured Lamprocystis sp. TaxID=543132 RepID=UPI0025DDD5AC|nr:Mor transcription activator family protein [uncultured Lamprocystis sp.]